ncbi:MAG: ABC transporter ATP-binding protein [Burkholderiaceae bacterium]|jgi:lipoprotein-releasing system ATP-binding protein|nr:ABC transporter ATP-binding protein [Burkholderiaceae bacterium]
MTKEAGLPGVAVLRAVGLTRRYSDGPREVVPFEDLSLELMAGQSLAVIGPSGVGKSTLLHLLGGLDKPTSGQVFIEGQSIYELTDAQRTLLRNKKLGFVYQFHHLLEECSALENVAMPLLIRREPRLTAMKQASDWLGRVGLESRLDHPPSRLSGGERQRVAIARALVNAPSLVLADEPTGNLDRDTAERVFELLVDRCREAKAGLVIVTHDLHFANRCDQRFAMTSLPATSPLQA